MPNQRLQMGGSCRPVVDYRGPPEHPYQSTGRDGVGSLVSGSNSVPEPLPTAPMRCRDITSGAASPGGWGLLGHARAGCVPPGG